MTNLLAKRFSELETQLKEVEATKRQGEGVGGRPKHYVDGQLLLNWKVKVKNLLSKACGLDSEHYKHFELAEKGNYHTTNYDILRRLEAVFLAAKEDFEGGYLATLRGIVQAELFDSELDQAAELLRNGYKSAAAVAAGVVLEATLRELCARLGIGIGKLDKMNADLVKGGAYSALVQKKVTWLAHIRNSAAHGKPEDFTENDVQTMLEYIQRFAADHL
jgi:hypothetical protein